MIYIKLAGKETCDMTVRILYTRVRMTVRILGLWDCGIVIRRIVICKLAFRGHKQLSGWHRQVYIPVL